MSVNVFENGKLKRIAGNASGAGGGGDSKIDSIKANGKEIPIDEDKSVDIKIPTKTSDLENDSGFITEERFLELMAEVNSIKASLNGPLYPRG